MIRFRVQLIAKVSELKSRVAALYKVGANGGALEVWGREGSTLSIGMVFFRVTTTVFTSVFIGKGSDSISNCVVKNGMNDMILLFWDRRYGLLPSVLRSLRRIGFGESYEICGFLRLEEIMAPFLRRTHSNHLVCSCYLTYLFKSN